MNHSKNSQETSIPFYEKPLDELNEQEWEALCDGCGLCCLNKLEDEDTDEIYTTRVACNLLNLETCQCSNYSQRKHYVPECIKLTRKMLPEIRWLPETCAYILRYQNKPLLPWHPLLCKDPQYLHQIGISMKGKMIHENDLGDADIEDFIIEE